MDEWSTESIDNLFVSYQRHLACLLRDVAATNRILGSKNPTKSSLKRLTRAEFEAVLTNPNADPTVIQLWVGRILRSQRNASGLRQAAS